MKNVLVLDPFSGISGDMFLAAMVSVGVPFEHLRGEIMKIAEVSSVEITMAKVTRGMFEATRIEVTCPHEHAHRSLASIRELIEAAELEAVVKSGAIDTFTRLAKAEARVHGRDIDEVHFHEVGALDAIVDIVGAHVALAALGHPAAFTRPVVLGCGSTQSEHGEIPIPAPATLELLGGYTATFSDRREELVTPTGAAILASRFKLLPAGTLITPGKTGYGAGARDRGGLPNVLRAITGRIDAPREPVSIITCTIDDMNPEMYGYLMEQLLENGALEVYYSAVMMKKNRPGVEVTVICEGDDVDGVTQRLLSTTTTLGLRIRQEERREIGREHDTVETPYGVIDVKVATRPDGTHTMSPEYESCRKAAERTRTNLPTVYDAARDAWRPGGKSRR